MAPTAQHRGSTRDTRLNLRVTSVQAELIRQAAAAADQTVTEFVVGSSAAAAQRVLADRRWFALDQQAWADFEELLARPVVDKPRLRARLDAPDPFGD